MANVTTADVKRLRELTGAGMMDSKNALAEADGDFDRAIEILRLKGAKDVRKRAERTASNGLVTAHVVDGTLGVLLELNCETDFVAKNERFQQLASAIAAQAASSRPADLPALLDGSAGGAKTVREQIDDASAALGERVAIRRFALLDGEHVVSYLHRTSRDLPPTIGVLVELSRSDAEVAKHVAQHIAAAAPSFVTRDEVPAETVERERRLAEQMARDEGKPEKAIPKIIEGRVGAYFKEVVLLDQPWVREPKQTINQVLADAGASVRRFARYSVGEA